MPIAISVPFKPGMLMLVNKTSGSNQQSFLNFTGRIQRVIIVGITTLIVGLCFLLFSWYPDLDPSVVVGKSGTLNDHLFVIQQQDAYLVKVMKSYFNWIMNHKNSMIFGLIIGGLVISLFKNFKFEKNRYSWINFLFSKLVATPLGACLKGAKNKRKIDAYLSMIVSSQSLNICIISLSFSMFPFYLAIIKLVFTFSIVFFLIPLISKTFGENYIVVTDDSLLSKYTLKSSDESSLSKTSYESWFSSFKHMLKDYYHIFIFILKTIVPFMFIGGFFSFVIVLSLEISSLKLEITPFIMVVISFLSLLIPVPISFDIMFSHVLYEAGMSITYTSILLCNFGVFSFYAFIIIWKSGLKRWALGLLFGIFILSCMTGLFTAKFHDFFYIESEFNTFDEIRSHAELKGGAVIEQSLEKQQKNLSNILVQEKLDIQHEEIQIFRRSFQKFEKPFTVHQTFTKLEGPNIGLTEGFQYTIGDYPDPFWIGRGSGAGDYNKDGWPDIGFGTSSGIALYQNVNGHFHKVKLTEKLRAYNVYAVAFVDLNNDAWLDLFFTSYKKGNFVILNDKKGKFKNELIPIPNNKGLITLSPAIADFDSNGYPDILNGNIALGVITGSRKFTGKGRENSLTYNENLSFSELLIPGQHGETMSTLASDINHNNQLDLYQAHDFIIPDQFFFDLNDFVQTNVMQNEAPIRFSPIYSRAVDSGDLNNDGLLDLVLTGTKSLSAEAHSSRKLLVEKGILQNFSKDPCYLIKDQTANLICEQKLEFWRKLNRTDLSKPRISECEVLSLPEEHNKCVFAMKWSLMVSNEKYLKCEQIGGDNLLFDLCKILRQKSTSLTKAEIIEISNIKQKNHAFVYIQQKNRRFVNINDLKQGSFLHPGGLTWNTKIVDLDSDGFQDIVNSEGAIRSQKKGWNTYMRNQSDGTFKQEQWSYKLTDPFSLMSFVLIDYDFDGDLDIIGNSSSGPVQVYRNETNHKSISFFLLDYKGNRFGIGAKIYLRTAQGLQFREVKASGGYLSFDPIRAHFGVGESSSASELTIIWPDGEKHIMPGIWQAGYQYEIRRLQDN